MPQSRLLYRLSDMITLVIIHRCCNNNAWDHSRRFIQKQNRQVNFGVSVNKPPSRGSATDAAPNILVTIDMYTSLFRIGTV